MLIRFVLNFKNFFPEKRFVKRWIKVIIGKNTVEKPCDFKPENSEFKTGHLGKQAPRIFFIQWNKLLLNAHGVQYGLFDRRTGQIEIGARQEPELVYHIQETGKSRIGRAFGNHFYTLDRESELVFKPPSMLEIVIVKSIVGKRGEDFALNFQPFVIQIEFCQRSAVQAKSAFAATYPARHHYFFFAPGRILGP